MLAHALYLSHFFQAGKLLQISQINSHCKNFLLQGSPHFEVAVQKISLNYTQLFSTCVIKSPACEYQLYL